MQKIIPALLFLTCVSIYGYGQSVENTGWFFLTHTQKITKKFDLLADVQLRSADRYDYLGTLLLRGALSYNFNKENSAAIGYASKSDWMHEDGENTFMHENRLYEQYLLDITAWKAELNARIRLEQRFVREEGIVDFSQRARVFLSAQVPLAADSGFTRGLYTGIQNELFLNVQHKNKVNNSVFDQNRSFISLGYRWSKKLDTELGYMYWYQKEKEGSTKTNIIQLMITTKF